MIASLTLTIRSTRSSASAAVSGAGTHGSTIVSVPTISATSRTLSGARSRPSNGTWPAIAFSPAASSAARNAGGSRS